MISSVPIYDYRCDECGHRFSAVQSFSDGPLEKCPNCGKRPRRLITAPAIVFKGSGWYKTDSRTAPKDADGATPSHSTEKDAKKETKTDTKSETKADGKPEAKTETKSESKSEPKSESKRTGDGAAKSEAKS
jgi:putative FmdB family regulatory protein